MPTPEQQAYDELRFYSLAHHDPRFIHQHVVDAFTAQHANEETKPIAVAFALIGLYLAVERNWSGREIQRAHMRLARQRRSWPVFRIPDRRGSIGVWDVIAAPEGDERDRMIHAWCAAAWEPWMDQRAVVESLLDDS